MAYTRHDALKRLKTFGGEIIVKYDKGFHDRMPTWVWQAYQKKRVNGTAKANKVYRFKGKKYLYAFVRMSVPRRGNTLPYILKRKRRQ